MKIRNFFWGTVSGLFCVLLISMQVLAYTYYVPINVTNTASTKFMLPIIVTIDNNALIAGSYMLSTGLDTDVTAAGEISTKPHMVADNKMLFVSDFLTGTKNFHYEMGNAAESSFEIITGYGGYVTTTDAAALDLGDDFKIEVSGYAMTNGAGRHILDVTDEVVISGVTDSWIEADVSYSSPYAATSYLIDNANSSYYITSDTDAPRNIVVASNGDIYACYTCDTYTGIHVDVSTDDGATWANSLDISGANAYNNPIMAIDSNDVIYLAYFETSGGNEHLHTRYYDGAWSGEETLETYAGAYTVDRGMGIAVDSTDAVHVAYPYHDGTAFNIRYANRANKGSAWANKTWLTSETVPQENPEIAIDGNDYIHVVWSGDLSGGSFTGNTLIRYREYTSSWQAIVDLDSVVAHSLDWASIAISPIDGHIEVVYTDYGGDLYYKEYTDSWQADSVIATAVGDCYYPSITVDRSGNLFAVYQDADDSKQYELHFEGVSWTSPAAINGADTDNWDVSTAYAYYPEIAGVHTNMAASGFIGLRSPDLNAEIDFVKFAGGTGVVNLDGFIGLPNGLYDIVLELDAGTLSLYFDGILHDSDVLSGDVSESANNWLWMESNVMPYADFIKVWVNDVLVVHYQPNNIISGTTLPDREGAAQNGAITWGTNPVDVTIATGVIVGGGVSPTSTSGTGGGGDGGGNNPPVVPPGETIPVITDNPMPPTATSPIDPFFDEIEDVTGGVFPVAWQKYAYSTLLCAGFIIFAGSRTQSFFLAVTAGGLGLGLSYLLHFFADIWIFWIFGFLALAALLLDARKSW